MELVKITVLRYLDVESMKSVIFISVSFFFLNVHTVNLGLFADGNGFNYFLFGGHGEICGHPHRRGGFPGVSAVTNLPAMQET